MEGHAIQGRLSIRSLVCIRNDDETFGVASGDILAMTSPNSVQNSNLNLKPETSRRRQARAVDDSLDEACCNAPGTV